MIKALRKDGFITLFLKGALVGIGNAIAGISGGTIAYITGIYGPMVNSLAHINKNFKKNIWYLFKVFLGVGVGLIGAWFLFRVLFELIMLEMVALFSGIIIGGIRNDRKDYHIDPGKSWNKYLISFIVAFIIVLGMSLINIFFFEEGSNHNQARFTNVTLSQSIFLFFMMIIGASCMIFPGISGSLCFMILGIYQQTKNMVTDMLLPSSYSNPLFIKDMLMVMIPLVLGTLVSLLFVSKPINLLYSKHKDIFDYIVLGFLVASIISMFILNLPMIMDQFNILHLLLAFLVFMPCGYFASLVLHKRKLKLEAMEKEGL